MFGAAHIGATMHIAIGVWERVLVERVALRKQRKRCADGVARGCKKAAGCQHIFNAPAENLSCVPRRRCAGIGLVAMVVIGMRSPPPIQYIATRKSVSAALRQARASTQGWLLPSRQHLLPARGNLAAPGPNPSLGVSTQKLQYLPPTKCN